MAHGGFLAMQSVSLCFSNKEQHYLPDSIWFALNTCSLSASWIQDAFFVRTACSSAGITRAQSRWCLEIAVN